MPGHTRAVGSHGPARGNSPDLAAARAEDTKGMRGGGVWPLTVDASPCPD